MAIDVKTPKGYRKAWNGEHRTPKVDREQAIHALIEGLRQMIARWRADKFGTYGDYAADELEAWVRAAVSAPPGAPRLVAVEREAMSGERQDDNGNTMVDWVAAPPGDVPPPPPGFAQCPECGNLAMNPLPSCPTCGTGEQ